MGVADNSGSVPVNGCDCSFVYLVKLGWVRSLCKHQHEPETGSCFCSSFWDLLVILRWLVKAQPMPMYYSSATVTQEVWFITVSALSGRRCFRVRGVECFVCSGFLEVLIRCKWYLIIHHYLLGHFCLVFNDDSCFITSVGASFLRLDAMMWLQYDGSVQAPRGEKFPCRISRASVLNRPILLPVPCFNNYWIIVEGLLHLHTVICTANKWSSGILEGYLELIQNSDNSTFVWRCLPWQLSGVSLSVFWCWQLWSSSYSHAYRKASRNMTRAMWAAPKR